MKELQEYLNESLLDDFGEQSKDAAKRHVIETWLEKNHESANRNRWPLKYKINKDYTIDINIFFYVGEGNFPEFIQFNKCSGNFLVSNSNMTSLRGCPQYVEGTFDCKNNKLKTLDGGPKRVDKSYTCYNNELTSLKGCPEYIGGNFDCSYNFLKTLDGGPKHVGGNYECYNNGLTSLRGCPQCVGSVFNCSGNFLKTLDGGPKTVKGSYFCRSNTLQTLDGGPTDCNIIYMSDNPKLSDDEIEKYRQRHPKVRVIK